MVWGGVWSTLGTHHPTATTSHSMKRRNMSSPKLRVYSSWAAIRLRWPRAVATKLAFVKTKRDGSVKSAMSWTFDARASTVSLTSHQKSSCHGSRTLPSRLLTSLWRPTSRICQALALAASTTVMPSIPSQFASTKRVIWVHLQNHPVRPCLLQSLVVGVRFSTCGQSMFQFEELRVQMYVDDPAWISPRTASPTTVFRSYSCSSGQPWARTCPGEKARIASVSIGQHLGFSAVWIEIHQHRTAELLDLAERLSLRKGLKHIEEVFTCRWSPRLGQWSFPVARDF